MHFVNVQYNIEYYTKTIRMHWSQNESDTVELKGLSFDFDLKK